jgi:exo-beta-1,3-glucanase (GH17 family)
MTGFHNPTGRDIFMINTTKTSAIVATALLFAISALAPLTASAREGGARSIGNGVKCYNASVLQANGTYKIERVCRKGV